jgi:hypothetical protein
MPLVPFDRLPGHARLWIFAADRTLEPQEREVLVREVETGLAAWNAHGSPVTWGHALRYDRFLLVGVDETAAALSGCSIDSAIHAIRVLEAKLGQSFLDHSRVFYREGAEIRVASRSSFRELAERGEVGADTVVFNNVVPTVGELRDGKWEIPASGSWHGRAFRLRVS